MATITVLAGTQLDYDIVGTRIISGTISKQFTEFNATITVANVNKPIAFFIWNDNIFSTNSIDDNKDGTSTITAKLAINNMMNNSDDAWVTSGNNEVYRQLDTDRRLDNFRRFIPINHNGLDNFSQAYSSHDKFFATNLNYQPNTDNKQAGVTVHPATPTNGILSASVLPEVPISSVTYGIGTTFNTTKQDAGSTYMLQVGKSSQLDNPWSFNYTWSGSMNIDDDVINRFARRNGIPAGRMDISMYVKFAWSLWRKDYGEKYTNATTTPSSAPIKELNLGEVGSMEEISSRALYALQMSNITIKDQRIPQQYIKPNADITLLYPQTMLHPRYGTNWQTQTRTTPFYGLNNIWNTPHANAENSNFSMANSMTTVGAYILPLQAWSYDIITGIITA